MTKSDLKTMSIDGEEFVLVKPDTYEKLTKDQAPKYSGALFKPSYHKSFSTAHLGGERGVFHSVGSLTATSIWDPKHAFETESHAQQFADAMNTIFELRDTSVLPVPGECQYFIKVTESYAYSDSSHDSFKMASLFPTYPTSKAAQAAIERVGEDRILKAAKVFKGIYE